MDTHLLTALAGISPWYCPRQRQVQSPLSQISEIAYSAYMKDFSTLVDTPAHAILTFLGIQGLGGPRIGVTSLPRAQYWEGA